MSSYEQQSFHCQIRAFSHGCFGGQDALAAQKGKTILATFAEDFGKKLQLNRLTLIVVVDLPGTQPKMYEMSSGKGWHRVRR